LPAFASEETHRVFEIVHVVQSAGEPVNQRVRDIKLEIPAPPLEPPDRSTSALSAFICVHLRPECFFFRPNAKTKTPYWPQMNADERG
jgi:hypothetical protein